MRYLLFFHHIHAHAWKLLLKYEWFSNLHLHFWFYYWAPASNFKFLSGYLHIDNTLTSQLIHRPLIPTKPTSSHLSSWLMASLSHWLLRTTTSILIFRHTIHSFIMPPRKILGLSFYNTPNILYSPTVLVQFHIFSLTYNISFLNGQHDLDPTCSQLIL